MGQRTTTSGLPANIPALEQLGFYGSVLIEYV